MRGQVSILVDAFIHLEEALDGLLWNTTLQLLVPMLFVSRLDRLATIYQGWVKEPSCTLQYTHTDSDPNNVSLTMGVFDQLDLRSNPDWLHEDTNRSFLRDYNTSTLNNQLRHLLSTLDNLFRQTNTDYDPPSSLLVGLTLVMVLCIVACDGGS